MEVLFLYPYQLGVGPKEGVRHVEFKTLFRPCSPVKGAQNQREGGLISLGQKPKYK